MAFTTTFAIEKPDYKTLRYDLILNDNFDLIDTYLKDSPGASAPGSPVVLTEGVKWRDTTNHVTKIYNGSAWDSILAAAAVETLNASGSTDMTTWTDLIDSGDAADPKYVIPVVIGSTTYYIPCFTTK
jgi:hypothetical protein